MKNPRESSATVEKAIDLLRAIAGRSGGVTLSQLVARTGQSKTVCYRLLQTLRGRNLVSHDPATGHYEIGFGLVELAGTALSRNALRNQASRVLSALARETGDAVLLFVPYGRHAMCVDRMDGDFPVKAAGVEIGGLLPIHAGGAPFAILSHLPELDFEQILSEPLAPATARATTDRAEIRRRAADVRTRGYAIGEEDAIEFVIAIGAPIFGLEGTVIGGVSVGGVRPRYDEARIGEIARKVRDAAREISARLGHSHRNGS